MMEVERYSITCSSPSSRKKRNAIVAPRPVVAVPQLKQSGTLPVYLPRMNEVHEFSRGVEVEYSDYEESQEAESELQQIFGCGFQTAASQDAYFDGLNALSIDSGDYPFHLSANMDFPRLGPSPVSACDYPTGCTVSVRLLEEEGFGYPLPSRAHNPMIQNSGFFGEEQQLREPIASHHLKLALGFAPFDTTIRTRNRSYSEPILPEQLKELKLL